MTSHAPDIRIAQLTNGLPDQCLHLAEADVRPARRKSGFDRALPAAIEVRGQSISLRLAAPRVEGHNFDSSSCCRSPIHVLARSASSLLAWSALPRAL